MYRYNTCNRDDIPVLAARIKHLLLEPGDGTIHVSLQRHCVHPSINQMNMARETIVSEVEFCRLITRDVRSI